LNENCDNLNEILSRYAILWEKLWFKEDDILNATLNKISKTTNYLDWLNQ
jgi:hypothetical protein